MEVKCRFKDRWNVGPLRLARRSASRRRGFALARKLESMSVVNVKSYQITCPTFIPPAFPFAPLRLPVRSASRRRAFA
jgi:hypothetical protein